MLLHTPLKKLLGNIEETGWGFFKQNFLNQKLHSKKHNKTTHEEAIRKCLERSKVLPS